MAAFQGAFLKKTAADEDSSLLIEGSKGEGSEAGEGEGVREGGRGEIMTDVLKGGSRKKKEEMRMREMQKSATKTSLWRRSEEVTEAISEATFFISIFSSSSSSCCCCCFLLQNENPRPS